MPYSAEISRANPTCFLFLVDQSTSMDDPFGGQPNKKKSNGVADAINRLLLETVISCSKDGVVLDRFHVGAIGYGSHVGPAFGGELAGRDLVPISEIAIKPMRIEKKLKKEEDGAGGLVEREVKSPIWLEPVASGGTPMCRALEQATEIIRDFITRFPDCHPPIVINITDGAHDGYDPEPPAAVLRSLPSTDGTTLLFNAHLSHLPNQPIEFPHSSEQLPDKFASLLFRMSSIFPSPMLNLARREGMSVHETSRGFVFNADLVAVIRLLDIGTRSRRNER